MNEASSVEFCSSGISIAKRTGAKSLMERLLQSARESYLAKAVAVGGFELSRKKMRFLCNILQITRHLSAVEIVLNDADSRLNSEIIYLPFLSLSASFLLPPPPPLPHTSLSFYSPISLPSHSPPSHSPPYPERIISSCKGTGRRKKIAISLLQIVARKSSRSRFQFSWRK